MPMDPSKMSQEMHQAQGQSGAVADEMKGMAEAIIQHIIQAGIVNFLPNTVLGTAPSGGPLSGGSASGGLISGVAGPVLATLMASKMGKGAPTPQLIGYSSGIVTHLTTGQVSFSAGGITGQCTNSPTSPGPLVGQGMKGKVTGLTGPGMADLAAKGVGQASATDELKKLFGAIVDHIQQNAEVTLPVGMVQGACPPGGGPLTAGVATGGKFS